MSGKRNRGSRGGKRVQRGAKNSVYREEAFEEERFIEEHERLYDQAHALYADVLLSVTGLRPIPRADVRSGHFVVPLPNDWFLEITSGADGPLLPPEHEEGSDCIFWLVTPDRLYAEEDERIFEGEPEMISWAIVGYAARLLWRQFDEIMGPPAKELRKNLPRPHAQKIKALVERGDFEQPHLIS